MKNLNSNEMKVLKTFHLIFVVMWLGGCFGMGLTAFMNGKTAAELLTLLNVSEALDYCVLIPGAVGTVITGAIYGLFSNWGFFRHRWLTVKWIMSIAIILIGTFFFHPYSLNMIAELEAGGKNATLTSDVITSGTSVLYWCGLQAIALILLIPISVFKPWKKKKH